MRPFEGTSDHLHRKVSGALGAGWSVPACRHKKHGTDECHAYGEFYLYVGVLSLDSWLPNARVHPLGDVCFEPDDGVGTGLDLLREFACCGPGLGGRSADSNAESYFRDA